jgi:hypothetical protein
MAIFSSEEMLMNPEYDGTIPAITYLISFDNLDQQSFRQDPDFDDFLRLELMKQQLKDQHQTNVGYDGKKYEEPATWLTRQPMENINTYTKLAATLQMR